MEADTAQKENTILVGFLKADFRHLNITQKIQVCNLAIFFLINIQLYWKLDFIFWISYHITKHSENNFLMDIPFWQLSQWMKLYFPKVESLQR